MWLTRESSPSIKPSTGKPGGHGWFTCSLTGCVCDYPAWFLHRTLACWLVRSALAAAVSSRGPQAATRVTRNHRWTRLTQTVLITPPALHIPLPQRTCPLAHQAGNNWKTGSYLIPVCATLSAQLSAQDGSYQIWCQFGVTRSDSQSQN